MRTTGEHGRTTRMLKIGRHNGTHAEVGEGRKKKLNGRRETEE
jgi:hypothetical protein